MTEAEALCDRVGILDSGKLVACDKPEVLKQSFAENKVRIVMNDNAVMETTKDASGAAIIAEALESGRVMSIHSEEPSLNEVFLRLTGKEFE